VITSNQIIQLSEVYISSKKILNGRKADIYENPTSSDITLMIKNAREENRTIEEVRFIADARSPQKVYVVESYDLTHLDLYNTLNLGVSGSGYYSSSSKYPYFLNGVARISSGKLVMFSWDDFTLQIGSKVPNVLDWFEKVFSYNWSFTDRYINGCSKYINDKKKQFEAQTKNS
jgi:hypothetical protein